MHGPPPGPHCPSGHRHCARDDAPAAHTITRQRAHMKHKIRGGIECNQERTGRRGRRRAGRCAGSGEPRGRAVRPSSAVCETHARALEIRKQKPARMVNPTCADGLAGSGPLAGSANRARATRGARCSRHTRAANTQIRTESAQMRFARCNSQTMT